MPDDTPPTNRNHRKSPSEPPSEKPGIHQLDNPIDPAAVDPTQLVHGEGSIQAAIDAAAPGDTIWIEPHSPFDHASYDEPLVIPESKPGLDLRSTNHTKPVLLAAASGPTPALSVYADDVTIRNIWCGPRTENFQWVDADAAFRAHDVTGLHLEDVRGRGATIGLALTDVTSATLAGTSTAPTTLAVGRPTGIQLADVDTVTMCNVNIRSANGTGLHVTGGSRDISVCHTRFKWNTGAAITIDEQVDTESVSIHRCDISANGGPGLVNHSETAVEARHTWWGHKAGPTAKPNRAATNSTPEACNPAPEASEATGQAIVGPITYRPVSTSPCTVRPASSKRVE